MIRDLLWAAAVVQGILVVALAVTAASHSVWTQIRLQRRAVQLRRATGALTQLFLGVGELSRAVAAVGALPVRAQTELLGSLGRAVSGNQRVMIRQVAERAGLAATGRRWCRSPNPTRRLHGVRILGNVGSAASSLTTLLADTSPEVRAESTRLIVNNPTEPGVLRLVSLLADEETGVVFAAKDALVRCGAATSTVLGKLRSNDITPRTITDLLDVAVRTAHVSLTPLATELVAHPDPLVRVGAVRLTAAIGSSLATTALTDLLDDEDAAVRAAAVEGLGRLGHWPATPRLAACLTDPSWDVRLAAGLSLRRLGAPGVLYLHRAIDHADAFARDMARQVLDLPDLRAAS